MFPLIFIKLWINCYLVLSLVVNCLHSSCYKNVCIIHTVCTAVTVLEAPPPPPLPWTLTVQLKKAISIPRHTELSQLAVASFLSQAGKITHFSHSFFFTTKLLQNTTAAVATATFELVSPGRHLGSASRQQVLDLQDKSRLLSLWEDTKFCNARQEHCLPFLK